MPESWGRLAVLDTSPRGGGGVLKWQELLELWKKP
jgi:hypothetical protein